MLRPGQGLLDRLALDFSVCGRLRTLPKCWSHGWAAAVQGHQVLVFRESNQGRSWITLRTHVRTPPGSCGPDQISAPGPRQGWLVVPGPVASGAGTTRIYASTDGGRTWHRIDQAALRTV
jgi:photosystem II stability/assembly factor-like uncharacterized protein